YRIYPTSCSINSAYFWRDRTQAPGKEYLTTGRDIYWKKGLHAGRMNGRRHTGKIKRHRLWHSLKLSTNRISMVQIFQHLRQFFLQRDAGFTAINECCLHSDGKRGRTKQILGRIPFDLGLVGEVNEAIPNAVIAAKQRND